MLLTSIVIYSSGQFSKPGAELILNPSKLKYLAKYARDKHRNHVGKSAPQFILPVISL
jgi:hypothetical protein